MATEAEKTTNRKPQHIPIYEVTAADHSRSKVGSINRSLCKDFLDLEIELRYAWVAAKKGPISIFEPWPGYRVAYFAEMGNVRQPLMITKKDGQPAFDSFIQTVSFIEVEKIEASSTSSQGGDHQKGSKEKDGQGAKPPL